MYKRHVNTDKYLKYNSLLEKIIIIITLGSGMPVTLQTSSTGFPSSTFLSFGFSAKTGGMPSKISVSEDCLDKLKREDGNVSDP